MTWSTSWSTKRRGDCELLRRYRLGLLAILLVAFALRLHDLALQDIWWDEARNIDVSLRPFWQIPTAPELDIHPPLYFWLLHGWGRLCGSPHIDAPEQIAFLARFLSVFAGVLAVALLVPLVRRLTAQPLAPLAAMAFGALSPFWLAESQEARMYTVGFALLTAAAVALLSVVSDRSGRRPLFVPVGLFVILSSLAFLTHYNAVFVLVAWYAWWGARALWPLVIRPLRRGSGDKSSAAANYIWQHLRLPLLCGLASALLVAPIAPIALRQIPGYANPNLGATSLAAYLSQNARAYLGGYAVDALPSNVVMPWLWLVLLIVAVGLVFAGVRGSGGARESRASMSSSPARLRSRSPALLLLLVWLLGALALYYTAVLDRGAFNVRYASFVTPALYALLGVGVAGWASVGRIRGFLGAAAMTLVALPMLPAVQADFTSEQSAREDISGVVAWLWNETQPGDVLFVDQRYPFGFYYERYAIDESVAPTGAEAAPARYLFVDINTLDERLTEWAGEAERVFWVQWFESDTDPRSAVPFLLSQAGTLADEALFRGYRVTRWDLSPPNEFSLAADKPLKITFAREDETGIAPLIETVGASLPGVAEADGMLSVVLRWQIAGDVEPPLKARVALYGPLGDDATRDSRIAQADERLLNDRHLLPGEWLLEDAPLNVYRLQPPADLAPGTYALRLLVYDADTLAPFAVLDEAGNPAGVEATLGEIRIK